MQHASCPQNKKTPYVLQTFHISWVFCSAISSQQTNCFYRADWELKKSWMSWQPYLTSGTWHNWVTQNCTQGFVGPCIAHKPHPGFPRKLTQPRAQPIAVLNRKLSSRLCRWHPMRYSSNISMPLQIRTFLRRGVAKLITKARGVFDPKLAYPFCNLPLKFAESIPSCSRSDRAALHPPYGERAPSKPLSLRKRRD